jgi:FKBP-type peptidyl-prolyl cis-trans isomerase
MKQLLLIIPAALVLAACTPNQGEPTMAPTQAPTAPPAIMGELQIEDTTTGSGQVAATGDTVSVHYTGTLPDGTVFDSSVERGQPFSFTLGEGMVIPGWEQGIEGMMVGGKRTLTIPPHLAYGERGVPGTIPPQSTLIFDVELIEVNP